MSQRNPHDKEGSEKRLFPSLDLIFELTKERIANQSEQVNALDSKANFVLGSATALVSTALVLQAVLLTPQPSQATPHIYCPLPISNLTHVIPLLILLLAYLCVLFSAFFAYRIRVYKQV